MDFSSAIQSKMRDINDGSIEPFILYRDKDGGWHCDHCQNQYGQNFNWVEYIKEIDPLATIYTGKDFSNASFPSVYDMVLYDRIRSEYYIERSSGRDNDSLNALACFFQDNVSAFTHEVTDYLTTLERPLAALAEMCPFDMATKNEGWSYSEDLAADAVSSIQNAVYDRLKNSLASDGQNRDGYTDLNKIFINDSEIILSENPNAEHRYRVVENRFTQYYNDSGENNIFTGHTNDYLDAVIEFTRKVQYNADCVQSRRELMQRMDGVDYAELRSGDCLPGSQDSDFTGKLIVVKASALKPEYRTADSQLMLCTHGNGARPNAIGTSVFGTELLSGDSVCYGRHQIEGIADPEKLPAWAAKKIAFIDALKEPGVFEYGGYHFKPYRNFEKRDGDWNKQMRNASSDRDLGLSTYDWQATEYSYEGFYAASGDSAADIFKCLENGKLYVPAKNELFQYSEPPQKTKPPQSKKPSLLGKLDDAKAEAATQNTERKDAPKIKKNGLEV